MSNNNLLKKKESILSFRNKVVEEARKRLLKKKIETVCRDRLHEITDTERFEDAVKSIVDDSIANSWD